MAKSINTYVSDQGEIAITISAANVAAIAAFTTAEEIELDGALRSMRRTNDPERAVESTRITGDTTPIVSVGDTVDHEVWEIIFVDDYYEGSAGEWGTDNLAAVEIFEELFVARQAPGGLQCTPAGGATGDIEITLVNPEILSVGQPETDADATAVNTIAAIVACEKHTLAAHA